MRHVHMYGMGNSGTKNMTEAWLNEQIEEAEKEVRKAETEDERRQAIGRFEAFLMCLQRLQCTR